MDQTTQQNAAMVEESNAASNTLATEAVRLRDLVGRFRLAGMPAAKAASGQAARPQASPARALGRKVAAAFSGNAALDTRAEWQEF
jgi:methyl-accepting chemotaxis protein